MDKYARAFGDDLLSKDKRLKYKWVWTRVASRISEEEEIKKWTHFQCSESKIGDWELEANQVPENWNGSIVSYEARIHYNGNDIASQEGFKTRLEAQIGAEKLLKDWLTKENLKYGGRVDESK